MRKESRKAVSPVIATVILVAVAITVAVAVAYWMGGIAGQYTKFEKVEVQSGWSVKNGTQGWVITTELKNSGSASSTLIRLFVNDVPLNTTAYGATAWDYSNTNMITTDISATGSTLESGQEGTFHVWVNQGYGQLTSGTTIDIKIHSAGGMDCIKLIQLV